MDLRSVIARGSQAALDLRADLGRQTGVRYCGHCPSSVGTRKKIYYDEAEALRDAAGLEQELGRPFVVYICPIGRRHVGSATRKSDL